MREIKFRVWHDGGMHYPAAIEQYRIGLDGVVWISDEPWSMVDSAVPLEFTGLRDDDGTEIYEGDILDRDGDILGPVEWPEYESGFKVLKKVLGDDVWADIPNYAQVIGNIYENPDLLPTNKQSA